MSRGESAYAARRSFVAPDGYGVPLAPVAGYYRMKLRSDGVKVGVRIWFGPPLDPDTGDEMDRGHRWQAICNGRYIDIDRVWPQCGGDPITYGEYDYLCAMQSWGQEHAPDSAIADPRKPIDLLTVPLPF